MSVQTVTGAFSGNYTVTENPQVGFARASIGENDTSGVALGNGTTAGNMDLHYEGGNTTTPLTATTSATPYVLSNLVDGLGRTIVFQHICALWIRLTEAAPAGYLKIEPGATNPFILLTGASGVIPVRRSYLWADDTGGLAVATGSADTIKITASAGSIKYLIGIAGTST